MISSPRFVSIATNAACRGLVQKRQLSSQCSMAVEKLRGALEEYRESNYSQCLPSRFKKDIVKAATNGGFNPTHPIAIDDLQRVMTNINMEHKVSRTDIETIFHEIGGANMDGQVTMPAERFMRECF